MGVLPSGQGCRSSCAVVLSVTEPYEVEVITDYDLSV